MEVYVVDGVSRFSFTQGVWIHYTTDEYNVARETLEAHIAMYKDAGVDTSPLESILDGLTQREHPQ